MPDTKPDSGAEPYVPGTRFYVGRTGKSVHRGVTMPTGKSYTFCGAEARNYNAASLWATQNPVTCKRCLRGAPDGLRGGR